MANLDEQLEARMKRSVTLLRADREPLPPAEARVFAALEARLGGPADGGDADHGGGGGGGDGGGDGGGSAGYASANIIYAAKIVAATVGLTAAGLLGLRVTARALETPPEPATVAAAAPITADPREPTDSSAPPYELDETTASDSAESSREHSDSARADSAPPPSTGPSPSEGPSADTMAAELALIGAARAASDPAATISVPETHAETFPEGLLSDEREVLWVLAACELETIDAATRRAQRFVDHRPHSPLVDRIVSACPEVGDRLTSLDAAGHGAGEGPTPER